jgi:hypothetical protein
MLALVTVALLSSLLLAQAPALPPQTPAPSAATTPSLDPATSAFAGDTGLILVAIKATAVADYELVIRTLQAALAADQDAARKAATKGWRVFKAATADAKGNALYIHLMQPAVPAFDYRPSLLVDALVTDLAPDMLSKYSDAFAAPPTKLDVTELANMAVAPVTKPEIAPELKKPGQ